MSVSFSKELNVDEKQLQKTAEQLKDEADGFSRTLVLLKETVLSLKDVWQGDAADAFMLNFSMDVEQLEFASAVFDRLAGDYLFSLNEYRNSAQKSFEIVDAIDL